MTLAVHELGMSFGRMDQPSERVRFLDDVDVTVAMDTRGIAGNQSMILDVDITPVIFRASYTEIMLIVDVVNKAAALASAATSKPEAAIEDAQQRQIGQQNAEQSSKMIQSRRKSVSTRPQVVVTKETVSRCENLFIKSLADAPHLLLTVAHPCRWLPTRLDWRSAGSASRSPQHQALFAQCQRLVNGREPMSLTWLS